MKSSLKPLLFSKHFSVSEERLSALGVFDPTLNADTLLFPDPLLLERSSHPEMRKARVTFEAYFDQVRKLLHAAKGIEGPALKAAYRKLSFPEVKGTCLGYGSGSIVGSGSGPKMTERLIKTGTVIVELGIDDPDLFMAIGLFEEDFGPDLIGDMFTNVAYGEILEFNQRILRKLNVQTHDFKITLRNGARYSASLPRNPCFPNEEVPILLMPVDILRDLPIALDWRGVQAVSEQNQEFRDSLNGSVANMWSRKTLESKAQLKNWALSGSTQFGDLLDMLHGMDGRPYDFQSDKNGELIWRRFGEEVAKRFPLKIAKPKKLNAASVMGIADQIIEQFRHMIEDRDIWRQLYTDDHKPRFEKSAQRLFYMTAHCYCEANGLDLIPEAESGRGPVDFKLSSGALAKVLVEIKLSTNKQMVSGYEKQLAAYCAGERTENARYVIIDVGHLGSKYRDCLTKRDEIIARRGNAPQIVLINGLPKVSASKLKN